MKFVTFIRVRDQIILNGSLAEKDLRRKSDEKEISMLRSSAAEYLTFIIATGESDVNAIYFDENVWLSQKTMGF